MLRLFRFPGETPHLMLDRNIESINYSGHLRLGILPGNGSKPAGQCGKQEIRWIDHLWSNALVVVRDTLTSCLRVNDRQVLIVVLVKSARVVGVQDLCEDPWLHISLSRGES
jgi:hypothetical protein